MNVKSYKMIPVELENLIDHVQALRAETQTLELKAAAQGCPTRLYDTLSSFYTQDEGGTILFGVDEQNGFTPVGVYNAQELMKHVTEQCGQMTPVANIRMTSAQWNKLADRENYPLTAVREAILNALIHRDYSLHTEGMPIQILLFEDRLEIKSPGGLYGRLRLDQLGKVQPDTRNPVLAVAMEVSGETENRYSGIPTMRRELAHAGLPEPEFRDERGTFVVCFRKAAEALKAEPVTAHVRETTEEKLLRFCTVPRSRQEIAKFLRIKSVPYAVTTYVTPLVEKWLLSLSLPEKPRSPKQRYTAIQL